MQVLMQTHATVQAAPLPTTTPQSAFGAGAPMDDPMRNFGYTVAAYALIWCILLGFVLLSWRRQSTLEARLSSLEASLNKAAKRQGGPSVSPSGE